MELENKREELEREMEEIEKFSEAEWVEGGAAELAEGGAAELVEGGDAEWVEGGDAELAEGGDAEWAEGGDAEPEKGVAASSEFGTVGTLDKGKGQQAREDSVAEKTEEPEGTDSAEETVTKGTIIREWIRDILVAIVVAIVIMQFIKPTIVKQRSMEPNFYTNDYLLVSRQAYGLFGGEPQRGDVIVFQSDLSDDKGGSKLLIKRVIGLPGDNITITEGKVYINGEMQIDSYTKDQMTNGEIVDLVVPENSLFCMGDNRLVSVDSRAPEVGFISYDVVVGKVVLRLFPFNEFGTIMNPYKGD